MAGHKRFGLTKSGDGEHAVSARDGEVTLEGTVPDSSQVDMAIQVAQGVSGVTSVQNALTIKERG